MKIHMVKKGDSLFSISQKYNVPLEELIKANPDIPNPDAIDVGMKVKIPAAPKPAYEMMHQHTVQQGDTLWKLSKAWGIPLADMIQANPQLKNPNVLLTGEVVNIPKLPAAAGGHMGNPGGHHGMPGLPQWVPGKKNTAFKPETGVSIQPAPELAAPAPQAVSLPPAPPAPVLPAMPGPVAPVSDVKQPYPVTFQPDQDLFAQFPVPAVEAGAQAPYPEPDYTQDLAMGLGQHYGHGYGTGYGHGHVELDGAVGSVYDPKDMSGFGYGDISQPGSGGGAHGGGTAVQGVTGYLPAYVPGLMTPSPAGAKPSGGCNTCGGTPAWQAPAAAPMWPQMPAAPTAPAAAWPQMPAAPAGAPAWPQMPAAPAGAPAWPQMPAAPAGAPAWPQMPTALAGAPAWPEMPNVPAAAPAWPQMPSAPAALEAVSPAAIGPYPGTGMISPAVGAAYDQYPDMGMPVTGTGVLPYGDDGYPAEPYAAAPSAYDAYAYASAPYGHDAYAYAQAPYGQDAYAHAVAPYGQDAHAYAVAPYGQDAHAYAVAPYGQDAHAYAVAPYGQTAFAQAGPYGDYPAADYAEAIHDYDLYCPPYYAGWPAIPPIPPLRPREEDSPASNDPSLSLHASEQEREPDPLSAVLPKKRSPKARSKSVPGTRSKTRRKESLPWIKW